MEYVDNKVNYKCERSVLGIIILGIIVNFLCDVIIYFVKQS